MEYYSTYKFYDEKKRRVAVFGRKIDDFSMEIFMLRCSKRDEFSKTIAKWAYESHLSGIPLMDMHPGIYTIGIVGGMGPKKTMLEWCKQTLLRKRTMRVIYEQDFLHGQGGKMITISKPRNRKV